MVLVVNPDLKEKAKDFQLRVSGQLPCSFCSAAEELLWHLDRRDCSLWRGSEPAWMGSCVTYSRSSGSGREGGLSDLSRSLPAPSIL